MVSTTMKLLTSASIAAVSLVSSSAGFLQVQSPPLQRTRPDHRWQLASYLETLSKTAPSSATSNGAQQPSYSNWSPASSSSSSSRQSYSPSSSRSTNTAPAPQQQTSSSSQQQSSSYSSSSSSRSSSSSSSYSPYDTVKVEDTKFTGPATPVQYVDLAPAPAPLASTRAPPAQQQQQQQQQVVIEAPPVGVTYEAYGDVDSKALLSKSTFPIPPEKLVALAKDAVFTRGLGMNDNARCLAENFVFRGSQVETPRHEFLRALHSFNLGESFRVKQQFFGWIVDPIQPNRVWFMNRQEAEQIQEFYGTNQIGLKLVLPPECLHVDFNAHGQVEEFGFYTVDRAQGNTGGLGGAFGYFYGVGKPLPFPEAHPYKMSKRRRFFEFVGRLLTKIQSKWASTRGDDY